MDYSEICKTYEKLESTSKGLEKTSILAEFLEKIKSNPHVIYLLQGKVFPDYDERELGISQQLAIKAISKATGEPEEKVISEFKKTGDLGSASENLIQTKKQSSLFSSKLTIEKVMQNLQKIPEAEGKGSVDRKINSIVELLHSAKSIEARYIIRTILGDLKIGVGSGLLRDAIVELCFKPESIEEKKKKVELVQSAYDKATDFSLVFEKACQNKLNEITLSPGKPVKVMLFPKAKDIEDAFRIVGKPAAFEFKYDGFRMMINKDKEGEIKIFTRRLDNVTSQFPDVVKYINENVKADSFIIDAEAVGYNPETKKYRPFQAISQRIKRKYDIEKLEKELPIELNVFDIIYINGKSLIKSPYKERRETLEKIIKSEKRKIVLVEQIITSDENEAQKFYEKALEEEQEGLMAKSLSAEYKPGARVGHAVKLKPVDEDFDLVITSAEYGTGKRAGWLTSFDVSCLDEETGELKQIGKVSTGLKEKPEQGLSYEEMTKMLNKIKTKESGRTIDVKPEIVVTVQYQNIQQSPTYSSGFALRFPRITRLRPDRKVHDIATIQEIEKQA